MATNDQLIDARDAALRILWESHALIEQVRVPPYTETIGGKQHEVAELSCAVIGFRDMLLECCPFKLAIESPIEDDSLKMASPHYLVHGYESTVWVTGSALC